MGGDFLLNRFGRFRDCSARVSWRPSRPVSRPLCSQQNPAIGGGIMKNKRVTLAILAALLLLPPAAYYLLRRMDEADCRLCCVAVRDGRFEVLWPPLTAQ